MAETRTQDDRHIGPYGKNLAGKLYPCHKRHSLIRYHEVEPGGVFPEKCKGLSAARCGDNIITELPEDLDAKLGERLFVVDEKDSLATGRNGSIRLGGDGLLLRDLREAEGKGGAFTWLALDRDMTVVALDDTVNDGKTQARALARRLCGEERVEDFLDDVGWNTIACVADESFM